ncbi:hypothetical protein PsorP6_006959 [Peronosclerospora sorghi]|uniref:Uncharacterized protein n=1 Tax=Peronosclerospora sorghi TaxID=230839 RepID=A0ACC0W8A7_9STRA|nr:hypothetical protein PsorP6_006959 [Peronosclerospora sorghi]
MSATSLRERVRQRRTEPRPRIELGASSANAYFTSKRIRQRPVRKTATNKQQAVEAHPANERRDALDFPSRRQVVAALRAVDEHVEAPPTRHVERPFPEWKRHLRAGFNLLVYGVGSKRTLLQEFASCSLTDGVVIQIHGYLPTVSLKYLTETLEKKCRAIALSKPRARSVPPIYLVVHSIDGLALRHPETQTGLSWLAHAPWIALLASMDHVNGPTLWKEDDALRFAWLSEHVDTLAPYTAEIELRLTKRAKTVDATSTGVQFILQSLAPTDVATLRELARLQLDPAATSTRPRGRTRQESKRVHYQVVYDACHHKLLQSTPLTMKNSVKCLEDHGLVKTRRLDALEYLEIPLPESIIKQEILHLETEA